ncbi:MULTISPECIES: hypothetical protein [unclassified Enterobacter]|nr:MULTISPECIES: hypothetical protein [unclassified Enterobacter]MEA3562789.1 hypothetical protein [Enterobacter sp. GM-22]MEA3596197.1 hypothetical protein [Enterobacter sp. GM-31]
MGWISFAPLVTAPDGNLSLYIRAYWGEQSILDGTWQPPKIETVK